MTDRHEVPLSAAREDYTRRILTEVEAGNGVSQRSLARQAGIALGLTNLLLRRFVRRGWIRIIHIRPNRLRYLITPAGIAEKARVSRNYLASSIRYYTEARGRIAERLNQLCDEWPASVDGRGDRRIVFYGAGEVAEIGYVCLQGTGLTLVGVVDVGRRQQFFHFQVHRPAELCDGTLAGAAFDRIVVMDFGDRERVEEQLTDAGLSHRVFWI